MQKGEHLGLLYVMLLFFQVLKVSGHSTKSLRSKDTLTAPRGTP